MKKILVIEDNHDVRENLEEILELSGYEVSGARDGKEGVSMAKSIQPDLILCDIMLPVLDGFGILQILSRDPVLNGVPFIFLTAKSELGDIRKGMNLGADDYITKPFQKDELLSVIEMRLKKAESASRDLPSEGQLKNLQRSREQLIKNFSGGEVRNFPPGFEIFSDGDRARNAYMIDSGIIKEYHISDLGRETIFRLYSKGQFPGLWEVYHECPYSNACKTLTEVSLRVLNTDDFREIMRAENTASLAIRDILFLQKTELEKKLVTLANHSVRKKVSRMLEELLAHGQGTADQPLELSRADLGALCGTAKETVTRTLSDFKDEGLITVQAGNVVVINEKALRELPD